MYSFADYIASSSDVELPIETNSDSDSSGEVL